MPQKQNHPDAAPHGEIVNFAIVLIAVLVLLLFTPLWPFGGGWEFPQGSARATFHSIVKPKDRPDLAAAEPLAEEQQFLQRLREPVTLLPAPGEPPGSG